MATRTGIDNELRLAVEDLLYAYADYLTLGIGELNRVQTQLQIGESYKAIGLNSEALKFFEKVKFADVNGAYTGRLFLDSDFAAANAWTATPPTGAHFGE